MDSQSTFEIAREKLSQIKLFTAQPFRKAGKSLYANRLQFLQDFVLLLLFGQGVTTGIIALIYN
ncbi:hypothetical protein MMC31_003395, partial [Peltigera leucophlebia]|nr:hypothetical protein [Peltigera leucophlebia]